MNKKIRTVYLDPKFAFVTTRGRRSMFTTDEVLAKQDGALAESIEIRAGMLNIKSQALRTSDNLVEVGVPLNKGVDRVIYEPSKQAAAEPED